MIAYTVIVKIDIDEIDAELPRDAESHAVFRLLHEIHNRGNLGAFRVKIESAAAEAVAAEYNRIYGGYGY